MMRRKLFSIGDTAVYLHLATLLYACYMVLIGCGEVLCISMISILMHEASHALTATFFGAPPEDIEITPMGALMRLEDETVLPLGKRLIMLAAGPGASFGLCWMSILLTRWGVLSVEMGRVLFCCNVLLLIGNLLPALPLDGGRMMALVLGLRFSQETVRSAMRISGTVIGLCCIAGNLFLSLWRGGWNLSLSIAGCFIMYASTVCTTTQALAELRMFMDRKIRLEKQGALGGSWLAVVESLSLRKAVKRLHPGRYTMLMILQQGSMKLLGTVGEDALIAAYLDEPGGYCKRLLQEVICERH